MVDVFIFTASSVQSESDTAGECWNRNGLLSIWSRNVFLLDHQVNHYHVVRVLAILSFMDVGQ